MNNFTLHSIDNTIKHHSDHDVNNLDQFLNQLTLEYINEAYIINNYKHKVVWRRKEQLKSIYNDVTLTMKCNDYEDFINSKELSDFKNEGWTGLIYRETELIAFMTNREIVWEKS